VVRQAGKADRRRVDYDAVPGVQAMTLPSERTRAVVYTRGFLFRLSSPYLPDGYKKIPKAAREEARRLLRHFPTVVDLAYPADSFDKAEAARLMGDSE
jgi:hypothetical protein